MKKTQILKKKTGRINKERVILWAIIFTLAVLQVISAWYLMNVWSTQKQTSKQNLFAIINSHEESRYKYPVIDIAKSRVYIPELHVYVPLNEVTRDLRYYYFETPAYKALQLSTSANVGAQNESDDPACDRMVELTSSKQPRSSTYYDGGEIQPIKDGLRYISVHNTSTCKIYQGNVQDDLAKAVKSIAQY